MILWGVRKLHSWAPVLLLLLSTWFAEQTEFIYIGKKHEDLLEVLCNHFTPFRFSRIVIYCHSFESLHISEPAISGQCDVMDEIVNARPTCTPSEMCDKLYE